MARIFVVVHGNGGANVHGDEERARRDYARGGAQLLALNATIVEEREEQEAPAEDASGEAPAGRRGRRRAEPA